MFSKIFIERPKLAMVISIFLSFAGLLCIRYIPIAEYPEIAPPTIMVIANYPGASAGEIQDTLAAPIESEVNGVEDLLYFNSQCNNDGSLMLTLTFASGTNDDIAMVNVQNAVRRAEPKLPAEATAIGIKILKRSSDILSVYAFKVDNKKSKMSTVDLGNYLRMNIRDELARIDGISQAEIMGASDYSMRIWLDPMKMASLGVTPDIVAQALRQQNVQAAAGSVGSENSNDSVQLKVNALGRLKTVQEFENVIIRTTAEGRVVKLRDVATVQLGSEEYAWDSNDNGEPVVALSLYRQSDANAIGVVDAANAKLKELSKFFPEGVYYEMVYDPTDYIRTSMKEVAETLLLTLILVVAITYLFLQNWRATLIPTLAIPVSLLATFIFLYPLGFSMNLLTMFGLILVIGSLVDDAIVVVENTLRIIDEEGLSPKEAALKSMNQITGAIIATTLVTIAVYVPIAFYGGMVGTIYIQFAVTMCISLSFSTFNAMTLSPALNVESDAKC